MLDDIYPSDEYETDHWTGGLKAPRPADILRDPTLSVAQKRAILASWASDARAVVDAPSLRQLDDGTVLEIDTILDALKQLDGEPAALRPSRPRTPGRLPHRRAWAGTMRRLNKPWRHDDDDDPPPSPVAARLPRLTPSLSGAAAVAAA